MEFTPLTICFYRSKYEGDVYFKIGQRILNIKNCKSVKQAQGCRKTIFLKDYLPLYYSYWKPHIIKLILALPENSIKEEPEYQRMRESI
jgi:hypothetical protein